MEGLARMLEEASSIPSVSPLNTPTVNITMATSQPTSFEIGSGIGKFAMSTQAKLIALVCAVFATFVSSYNIHRHLVQYNRPQEQRPIIRILGIVPMYSVFSFLTLVFEDRSVYFESIRDVWEAVVVYSFLILMLEYCGGENACLSVIMNQPGSITQAWPFNWCCSPIALDSTFFRWCKRATLQFVIVKPIVAITNLVFLSLGRYYDYPYQLTLFMVYNFSYTIALYSLLLFYKATHSHPGLVKRNPLYKFLAVKTVVFATYYQSAVIPAFDLTSEEAHAWNSFLLCVEMVFFSLLHLFSFNSSEYKVSALRSPPNSPHGNRNRNEFSKDGDRIIEMSNESDQALRNARDVMSVSDVAKDAYYNFNSKYATHVQLGTESESNLSPNQPTTAIDLHDTQPGSEGNSESRSSRNMFEKVGTTIRSLQRGGDIAGTMDEEGGGAYRFEDIEQDQRAASGGGEGKCNL